MSVKSVAKTAAEKGAKLWAAKKGLQMTGSLLKWGAVAGVGYLGFKFIKKRLDAPEVNNEGPKVAE